MPLPSRMPALAVKGYGRAGAVFYLHGFASSPKSTKVGYFGDRLREHGIELRCPDLNQPDFATLTLTRMLGQLGDELAGLGRDRAVLIGSSLGGTLAILAAAQFEPQVDRLVLLAPAVMFAKPGHHLLPPERIDEWRRLGRRPFFHYADNAERMLDFAFYEDSFRYNPFDATFSQPTRIVQGTHDTSVDPQTVEAFARERPNVTLSLVDDDHSLTKSLPVIWDSLSAFLEVE